MSVRITSIDNATIKNPTLQTTDDDDNTYTISLPNRTDTVATLGGTETLNNKIINWESCSLSGTGIKFKANNVLNTAWLATPPSGTTAFNIATRQLPEVFEKKTFKANVVSNYGNGHYEGYKLRLCNTNHDFTTYVPLIGNSVSNPVYLVATDSVATLTNKTLV